MKNFYSAVLIAMMPVAGMAQIGVGTTSLDATAMLQVNASASTNAKGFLGPRVALTSTSANSPFSVTPATGLMVYNTATAGSGSTAVSPGYYSYTGSSWERLASAPTTFVTADVINGFPTGGGEYFAANDYSWGPLGEITLPPGRWEIVGEFSCMVELGFNAVGYNSRENTYWISESVSGVLSPNFPLPLSSLTASTGKPTTDAIFEGSAVVFLPVESASLSSNPLRLPKQIMKFYINNSGAVNKKYYLNWHESYYSSGDWAINSGGLPFYRPQGGTNRLYAVKIQ